MQRILVHRVVGLSRVSVPHCIDSLRRVVVLLVSGGGASCCAKGVQTAAVLRCHFVLFTSWGFGSVEIVGSVRS